MFFMVSTSKRKVLFGKEKNHKRQILFFPGRIKFLFSQMESLLNELSKNEKQEIFKSTDIQILSCTTF